MILDRLKELVNEYYMEPIDEKSLVLSWQSLRMIFQCKHQKLHHFKGKKKRSNPEMKVPDIREMFCHQAENGQRNE